jgi:hypothetical protein
MQDKSTIEKAKQEAAEGKSPGTQAGEFVRDEIEKVRHGEHGVRSAKQAIAIGLSEARRAGVKLPPPKNADAALKKKAKQDEEKAYSHKPVSAKRSKARIKALKREPDTVSHASLSKQARSAAQKRSASDRSRSAKKAAKTRSR